ncbi:hypothetical protein L950_0202045 [Sphingobacterium sp. IITKGP-BTPF85]|nr:hypothetical protein L950_0202045 [Sphingobacterium sp. IITKGP-BTPF85]
MDTNVVKITRILVAVDDEPCSHKAISYAKEMVKNLKLQ